MSRAEKIFEKTVTAEDKQKKANAPDDTADRLPTGADQQKIGETADSVTLSARQWPLYMAAALSVLWVGISIWFLLSGTTSSYSPPDIVAGMGVPLVLVWLAALVIQRSDPMLERRVDLSRTLHKVISPVELAEHRLATLTKTLKKELDNINAVSDLASDRIENLEKSFQEQVSDLFTATADAEARSTSIRDIISRERTEIDTLTGDLVDRIQLLEDKLEVMLQSLETARTDTEISAKNAEESALKGSQSLSSAGHTLEKTMTTWQQRLQGESDQVLDIVKSVEQRVQTTTGQMDQAITGFTDSIGAMNSESDAIAANLADQAGKMTIMAEEAAEQSKNIAASLKDNIAHVSKLTEEAAGHTEEITEAYVERTVEMDQRIKATLSDAHALLENVGQAQIALTNTTDKLSGFGDDVVARAEETTQRSLNHIRQLMAGVEDQLHELEAAGLRTGDQLRHLTSDLSGQGDNLLGQVSEATLKLQTAQEEFSEHGGSVGKTLLTARDELTRLEEDLKRQQDILSQASEAAAARILAATDQFKGEGIDIAEAASTVSTRLNDQSRTIVEASKSMVVDTEAVEQSLLSTTQRLGSETSALKGELKEISQSLDSAADSFSGERKRIREESEHIVVNLNEATNQMVEEINKFTDSSMAASNRLDGASQALMDETLNAQRALEDTIQETQKNLEGSVQGISDKASEQITYMQNDLQATLSRLLEEYQSTARHAQEESDRLAGQMGQNAERITAFSTDFQKKADAIERRLSETSRDEFARTSQLLMESLHSLSIDIHKGLATDIPDDLWERYIDGDRSVFLRRTLQLGDRKSKKVIRDRYSEDPEFKEVVARYLRDFEDMIERIMLSDRGSTMSVTLLSSDVGKLYILLAQALKKFA